MTQVSATINVTRDNASIEVEIVGRFVYFTSANPNERGQSLIGWWINENPIKLTPEEVERAEQALYDAL